MILELTTLVGLMGTCQNQLDPSIVKRIIDTESARNPYAVAVVGGEPLKQQPKSLEEALAAVEQLKMEDKKYSLGLMQIYVDNFPSYNLTPEKAFDACSNIKVGADIYAKCYARARNADPNKSHQELLNDSASCYYSGNFLRGYKPEGINQVSYVDKFNQATKLDPSSNVIREVYNNEQSFDNDISLQPPKQTHQWDVFADFRY